MPGGAKARTVLSRRSHSPTRTWPLTLSSPLPSTGWATMSMDPAVSWLTKVTRGRRRWLAIGRFQMKTMDSRLQFRNWSSWTRLSGSETACKPSTLSAEVISPFCSKFCRLIVLCRSRHTLIDQLPRSCTSRCPRFIRTPTPNRKSR